MKVGTWSFELAKRTAPLSSNTRKLHWAKKAQEHRDLRWQARTLTVAAIGHGHGMKAIDMELVVHPPDQRKRDSDNLIAHLLKPVKDGVAEALRFSDDTDERIQWRVVIGPPTEDRCWHYVVTLKERV